MYWVCFKVDTRVEVKVKLALVHSVSTWESLNLGTKWR
jgi:hypothetical protein